MTRGRFGDRHPDRTLASGATRENRERERSESR
jgi:hypothetical protein